MSTRRPTPLEEVVRGLGTVVGVWAHPDNGAYLPGWPHGDGVDADGRGLCVS